MSDKHYYGCCACIGAAGIGLVPKIGTLLTEDGIVMNLYVNGKISASTPSGRPVTLDVQTEYPKLGTVKITIGLEAAESFALSLRIPEWSHRTALTVCGEPSEVSRGYTTVTREFRDGDTIELTLDMRTQAILPIPYGEQILINEVIWGANYMIPTFDREDPMAARHIALRRGPVMLAEENRLGYSVDDPIDVLVEPDGYVDVRLTDGKSPYKCILEAEIPLTNGKSITVTDYSSAGKTWSTESKMAVWMLTE